MLLSNGPGDPAATGEYAIPTIKALVESGMPVFGICLGHQMLALALGAKTRKMAQGHHGANHPVKDLDHGQGRDRFDESRLHGGSRNIAEGCAAKRMSRCSTAPIAASRSKASPCFRVQYHPEASPGPMDSHYLFGRFVDAVKARAET